MFYVFCLIFRYFFEDLTTLDVWSFNKYSISETLIDRKQPANNSVEETCFDKLFWSFPSSLIRNHNKNGNPVVGRVERESTTPTRLPRQSSTFQLRQVTVCALKRLRSGFVAGFQHQSHSWWMSKPILSVDIKYMINYKLVTSITN